MIFWRYLKDRSLILIVLLGSFLILSSTLYLYSYALDMILYTFLLIGVFVLLVGFFDYRKYLNQHKTLQILQQEQNIGLSTYIDDNSLKGEDYKKILEIMEQDKLHALEQKEEFQKEILDYFTLWAHQAKLPIAAMKLCLESEEIDEKELKTQILRMESYTDMVLVYLKMNSTQSDYVFRECDLDNMIRQAVRHFSSEFIYRKISLDFKETKLKVLTDEKWFEFVLEQILSNALKYTNEQGIIKIYNTDETHLVIEDTGIGIEAGNLKRVFEKGYTGYNGRLDKKASVLDFIYVRRYLIN